LLRMSHDSEKIVAGGNEDGEVFWFAVDFAKQVSNTGRCAVRHQNSVSCVKYFETLPLMCTADSESCVIFWSLQPLRSFEFFTKLEVNLVKKKGSPSSTASQQSAAAGIVGITSLALSCDEDALIVGSEHGNLVSISIESIVERAKSQQAEILLRKEQGEAADVISGRIFDSMEKPRASPEYVYSPDNTWLVEGAHRGSIDQIIYCTLRPPIIITLGFDVRVCIWHPETGEALGTLEQGLSEGLSYERRTKWRFPVDAHRVVGKDLQELADARVSQKDTGEDESAKDSKEASEDGKGTGTEQGKKKDDAGTAAGKEGSPAGSRAGSEKGEKKKTLSRSESAPNGVAGAAKQQPFKLNGIEYPDYSKTASRLLQPCGRHGVQQIHPEWFAGPLGRSNSCGGLPTLSSGMRRSPNEKAQNAVVTAAKQLSKVLSSLDGKKFDVPCSA